LTTLIGNVATHLWRHWSQLKQVLMLGLAIAAGMLLLESACKWCNWQLESATGRLRQA